MSIYGRTVRCEGIQWKVPVTSESGLSELLSITYMGRVAKMVSSVRTIRRVHTKDGGGAVGVLSGLDTLPPA